MVLTTYSFSKTTVVGPLPPRAYECPIHEPLTAISDMNFLLCKGFKSSYKAAGYSHITCALLLHQWVHATIASQVAIISIQDKTSKVCSPSAACPATSSTMKISHQGRSFPVSLRFLYVLQTKCVILSAIGSYHLVLVGNQNQ